MATHSNILAWEISWTEDPGGLQFMGLQNSHTIQQLNNKVFHVDGFFKKKKERNLKKFGVCTRQLQGIPTSLLPGPHFSSEDNHSTAFPLYAHIIGFSFTP